MYVSTWYIHSLSPPSTPLLDGPAVGTLSLHKTFVLTYKSTKTRFSIPPPTPPTSSSSSSSSFSSPLPLPPPSPLPPSPPLTYHPIAFTLPLHLHPLSPSSSFNLPSHCIPLLPLLILPPILPSSSPLKRSIMHKQQCYLLRRVSQDNQRKHNQVIKISLRL